MINFTGYRLIQDEDSYQVILYVDQQLSEFGKFSSSDKQDREKLNAKIISYLKQNLPQVKIKTIHIMVGSLLIASIPISSIIVSNYIEGNSNQTQVTDSINDNNKIGSITDEQNNEDKEINQDEDSIEKVNSNSNNITDKEQIPDSKDVINNPIQYVVRSGDTLYKISNRYNISVHQLKEFNGLTSNTIYVGQTLNLPSESTYNDVDEDRVIDDTNINHEENDNTIDDNNLVQNPSSLLALVNKQYSLTRNYIPENMRIPNIPFPFQEYNPKKLLRQEAASAIENLFAKAQEENIDLYGLSGYRSYDRQKEIFEYNVRNQGLEAANQFSAKPGESEHQTGLVMDVTSSSVNFNLTQRFGQTKEGIWLKENAADFGFIIRYPKGKEHITGYQYEPWHIRYVGIEAAKEISDNGLTLEEYLATNE